MDNKTIKLPSKVWDKLKKDNEFIEKQNKIRQKYGFPNL